MTTNKTRGAGKDTRPAREVDFTLRFLNLLDMPPVGIRYEILDGKKVLASGTISETESEASFMANDGAMLTLKAQSIGDPGLVAVASIPVRHEHPLMIVRKNSAKISSQTEPHPKSAGAPPVRSAGGDAAAGGPSATAQNDPDRRPVAELRVSDQALALLRQSHAADKIETDLDRVFTRLNQIVQVPLHQHEYDALVGLALKTGKIAKFEKLLGRLNTLDYHAVGRELQTIAYKGKMGLEDRLESELNMFTNRIYANVVKDL